MKRRRAILGVVAVAIVAGIVWWWAHRPGLSRPMEMVDVQPGEFMMGGPDNEGPQHPVRITYAFKMGKHEVTQKQWREVMGTTIRQQRDKGLRESGEPSLLTLFTAWLKGLVMMIVNDPSGTLYAIRDYGVWQTLKSWAGSDGPWQMAGKGDNYPMYFVNWDEAVEFCKRLTGMEGAAGRIPAGHEYRLPTEAEWEYACRAGSTTHFANGNTDADLSKIGWYDDNSGDNTHPVGTKSPNAWGLYDMHGNVSEWCLDWHASYPWGNVIDPFPATRYNRVIRGGSWIDSNRGCRSTSRGWREPGCRYNNLGFRVVLGPPVRAGEAETGK